MFPSLTIGMEEVMWGRSTNLGGQLGPVYVFEEFLASSQIRSLHTLGSNKILTTEIISEMNELTSKLVLCFSSLVCSNFVVTNLAPDNRSGFDGHTLANPHQTSDAKVRVCILTTFKTCNLWNLFVTMEIIRCIKIATFKGSIRFSYT